MTILALDTTTETASVALRRRGQTVSEQSVTTSDGHAYLIFSMIQAVLEAAGVPITEVDCFASAAGPGSFTGVRICLAAAKGLADATGKQAAGISNLRALATFGTAELRNPVIDARRGQIYTALYNSQLQLVSDEIVIAAGDWPVSASVERIAVTPPLAAAIAYCAELDGPAQWLDPSLLDAHYVRHSDAQASWADRIG